MIHVPYKGSGRALQDLLGGHVTLMVDSLTSALPSIQSGKLRAIGVTTRDRVPAAPAIPAIGEQLAGYEAVGWIGAFLLQQHELLGKVVRLSGTRLD